MRLLDSYWFEFTTQLVIMDDHKDKVQQKNQRDSTTTFEITPEFGFTVPFND